MSKRIFQLASILVLLNLATIQLTHLVRSLSISTDNKSVQQTNGRLFLNEQQQQTNQQQQAITTLPPLITTIIQDSIPESFQNHPNHQQQQQHQDSIQQDSLKQRSHSEDHDDSVPLATINNHSRNKQPNAKPPQYVDVSALIGVSLCTCGVLKS